ncbi:MAG TPA: flavodoxin family protein [Sedimentisphaerales bacterium]|nr:flavodoxin family protein [Sedimentisphaerales bacterium]HRS11548.1 flavodoxin family protein [Sedimentisphaerales bacterium]HRV48200.1 flavodoxin family protein [Sedimentisphaerales bacterium]
MKNITRRDFVRDSLAAGVTAAAVASTAQGAEGPSRNGLKIVGISCSPRQGQTTATSLKVCLEAAGKVSPRIETELIELAGLKINGSLAAGIPLDPGEKDDFPSLIPRLTDPNVRGIIIGTPVYFGNMSALCKAFLDRCIAFYQNDLALSNKVGGVLAVGGTRNGGQEATVQSVQVSLFCQEMIVVGNGRPYSRFGATLWSGIEGGVTKDEYGMTTARNLGRRVAETVLRMQS